jgi:uncharacterized protein YkwD
LQAINTLTVSEFYLFKNPYNLIIFYSDKYCKFILSIHINMNRKLILLAIVSTLFLTSNMAQAEFNFCSGNNGGQAGSGTFQQQIPFFGIAEVGELPIGVSGVEINLTSTQDIDIQLYDKITGEQIIHWPYGILAGSGYQSLVYHDVFIEWSGYNGEGGNPGNEFIRITGANDPSAPSSRAFIMKVFGYTAGLANVNYTWDGAICDDSGSGSGSFEQQIVKDDIVIVGEIPGGINNLEISLESPNDVDIQLYDAESGTAIVAWPSGILKGSTTESIIYENMEIEWSGYNGVDGKPGYEYIKINGETQKTLIMKAFGYESGVAAVTYSWGNIDNNGNNDGSNNNDGTGNSEEEQVKAEILALINQVRSQGRNCGGTFYPAVNPLSWNSRLYQAALAHTKDMVTNNFFDHTGSDGSDAGTRITAAGYSWSTYRENIAAGYFSAQSVVDGWLTSSGHCRNIMNSSITDMGVAKASGGSYGMYWTQVFARPF